MGGKSGGCTPNCSVTHGSESVEWVALEEDEKQERNQGLYLYA